MLSTPRLITEDKDFLGGIFCTVPFYCQSDCNVLICGIVM